MTLQSYLSGRWTAGAGEGEALIDPTSGDTLARASSADLDFAGALHWSRAVGGAALRAMSYAERAAALDRVAVALSAHRDEYLAIAIANSGNTPFDAAFDIDGAIGTVKFYAKLGRSLGESVALRDGDPQRLARDENFQGLHLLTPRRGVAVQINAFNFPAWGLWEKAAVALLSGVPVLAKPATATVWLAQKMVADVVAAAALPDGALSILCGSAGELLDHLEWQDAVAFTGSAVTAARLRAHPRLQSQSIPLNAEADSLNACALGADVAPGSPMFAAFVKEVCREITVKAGQKCTAIRRILVPRAAADAVADTLAAALSALPVGNPRSEGVRMGPLVSRSQQADALRGLEALQAEARLICGGGHGSRDRLVDADPEVGCFLMPTLLRADAGAAVVHDIEVFGPVATLIAYDGEAGLHELAARGRGSLVMSAFSEDVDFIESLALATAHAHGRLMLVDAGVMSSHTGHGNVLPGMVHGGPGRAGGGEELGGFRGMHFYHQRTAVQASAPRLLALAARTALASV